MITVLDQGTAVDFLGVDLEAVPTCMMIYNYVACARAAELIIKTWCGCEWRACLPCRDYRKANMEDPFYAFFRTGFRCPVCKSSIDSSTWREVVIEERRL